MISKNPQGRHLPTRASVRQLLGKVLRTDAELQAFCLDHFPDVAERYTDTMDRLIKLNLLLACVPTDQLIDRLYLSFHELADRYSYILAYTDENDASDYPLDTMREHRNRSRMLTKIRKFWIEGVLENSLHGRLLIELGKDYTETGSAPWDSVLYSPPQSPRPVPQERRMRDLFDEHLSELLILGAPGSGKTTMLLDLCRDLLARAERASGTPIPVVLNLSTWAQKSLPIADWIIEELRLRYDVPSAVGTAWSRAGLLLPLLDGLDELTAEFRSACSAALNHYRQTGGAPGLVVCCRQSDYGALTPPLHTQTAIILKELSAEQIEHWLAQVGVSRGQLVGLLGSENAFADLARSPLSLDILTRVLRSRTGDDLPERIGLEERRKDLFGAYFRAVMLRRRLEGRYSPEQTLRYLCEIARRLNNQSQSAFYLEELQPEASQTRLQRWGFRFGSTFLLWLLIGIVLMSLQTTLLIFKPIYLGFDLSPFPSWFYAAVLLPSTIVATIYTNSQEPPDQPDISFNYRLSRVMFFANIKSSIKQGIRSGVYNTLVWSIFSALLAMPFILDPVFLAKIAGKSLLIKYSLRNVVLLFGVQFLVYFVTFLIVFLPSHVGFRLFRNAMCYEKISEKNFPNQVILASLRRTLTLLGCLLGMDLLLKLLITSYDPGTNRARLGYFALSMLAMALPMLLTYIIPHIGGLAVSRHYTLRALLAMRGALPLRLIEFLDFATERVLLQRVGGGYVFIHRLLAEYFAELSPAERRALVALQPDKDQTG